MFQLLEPFTHLKVRRHIFHVNIKALPHYEGIVATFYWFILLEFFYNIHYISKLICIFFSLYIK